MMGVRQWLIALPIIVGGALESGTAVATDGYFQYGYGARQKALGGASVADSRDATAAALNPAGLVDVEDPTNIALSIFRPLRGFVGSGEPGLTPLGAIARWRKHFIIPTPRSRRQVTQSHLTQA